MIKEDIQIDQVNHLAYVYLSNGEVARTELVHPSINLDLNAFGEIFGVEFLNTLQLNFTAETSLDCSPESRDKFISAILCAQDKVRQTIII